MTCPRCGSETRVGQKFCANCGLALATSCPSCGTPYEGNPKFCAECGHALATADGSPGAQRPTSTDERRLVTVLFADLVGFTTISEPHDPEEVRDLLSRYFDTARAVIAGYGGTVEKFIGDAVMAVWGAPLAREDDAERAVRAALELVERVRQLSIGGHNLALRAGVLTGEAAVRFSSAGEGMVAGDLVNTASRLQSIAPADTVLVGETTYRATNAAIAYEEIGEQALKGRVEPVPAWKALRVVARVGGEAREEALEPPFVGRDSELELLKEQLHAAERERRLRLVSITGQAGIGKSRLIWELEKYLDGLAGPKLYYWHQGRTPSYGEGIAFWALGEMVRRRAGIAESEDPASTRQKLHDTLAQFVPDADERRWLKPALLALLGLEKPDSTREELFSGWRTFFERVAEQGPAVLVFEDLQWADAGLLDFIEHIAEWSRDRPILLVTLARPELFERRPNFGLGQRSLVAMHLEPLPDSAMRDMLRGVVPALGDADLARIVQRAEGVPLYAVETLRALADLGHLARRGDTYDVIGSMPELAVPPTLRALIAARLDALEPAQRELLQDASVLGSTFTGPVLAALSGVAADSVERELAELTRKELVSLETDPRSPERGRYRFMQAMIREVAYATLGRRDRRARHLAAAAYYETQEDEELAGIRATHYLEAFKASPEGEEGAAVAAQARVALRAAADRAARLFSSAQALHYYEQLLAVTFEDADIAELELLAARVAGNLNAQEVSYGHARRSVEIYDALGRAEDAAMAVAIMGEALLLESRVDDAIELMKGRLARLRELGAPPSRATMVLSNNIARGYLFQARPQEALAAVDDALSGSERLGGRGISLHLLITKAWAQWANGLYREALALLLGCRELADREGDPSARSRARFNLSAQLMSHDPHAALRTAYEGLEVNAQYGIQSENMAGNTAGAALGVGKLDEVLRLHSEYATMSTSMSSLMNAMAAIAQAMRGQVEEGRRLMAPVKEIVASSDSAQDVASLALGEGMFELAAGNLDQAHRHFVASRDSYLGGDTPLAAVFAGHAAALMADADLLRGDVEWLTSNMVPADWLERSTTSLQAALAALDGDAAAASAGYRGVLDKWRAADLPYDLALTLLERAYLLGDLDPEAAAGREEARQALATMGAESVADRLDAAVAKRRSATPRAATRAAKETSAARSTA